MLNLLNLVPLAPLDGGRLAGVISPKLWLIGAPMLVGLFLWRPSPLLILLAIAATPHVIGACKGNVPGHATLETSREKWRYGAQYIGLAAALAVMAFEAHEWLQGSG